MIKPLKFGEGDNITKLEEKVHTVIDDVKGIKEATWDANQISTAPVQMIDPGIGGAVILRHFFYKAAPRPKGVPNPTKQELVSAFKRQIEIALWGDGLVIREDKPIEVHTRQTTRRKFPLLYRKLIAEKADFVIICLAKPKLGETVLDKPLRV